MRRKIMILVAMVMLLGCGAGEEEDSRDCHDEYLEEHGECVDSRVVDCVDDTECAGGRPFCSAPDLVKITNATHGGLEDKSACVTCIEDEDCSDAVCIGNTCTDCRSQGDCGDEETCRCGRCEPLCDNDDDCLRALMCVEAEYNATGPSCRGSTSHNDTWCERTTSH